MPTSRNKKNPSFIPQRTKEEQRKPKVTKRKKMIKIRMEINKTQTKKTMG